MGRVERLWFAFAVGLCLSSGRSVVAQPVPGKTQPDKVNFGIVQVGSEVQGSVRVFIDATDTSGLAVNVQPPEFVGVSRVDLGTQEFGRGNIRGYCDIAISINTDQPGELGGLLRIKAGPTSARVPVATVVIPADNQATRLLVAQTPFEKFSTSDASLFDTWRKLVRNANFDVHYRDVQRGGPVLHDLELAGFDVVFLGETGLVWLDDKDVEKLTTFITGGGRVVIAANSFFVGTVENANRLLTAYGLQLRDEEGAAEITPGDFAIVEDELTKGIQRLSFRRASPILITDPQIGKVLVQAKGFPGQNLGFVAVGRSGEGEIIALGQSLWWSWVTKTGNEKLLRNILSR